MNGRITLLNVKLIGLRELIVAKQFELKVKPQFGVFCENITTILSY